MRVSTSSLINILRILSHLLLPPSPLLPPQPTHLANFSQVQSIQYSCLEDRDRKGMLQLNVAGAAEVGPHHDLTTTSPRPWDNDDMTATMTSRKT